MFQIFGKVDDAAIAEQVFREFRAYRIYDSAAEVQKWSLARKIERDGRADQA